MDKLEVIFFLKITDFDILGLLGGIGENEVMLGVVLHTEDHVTIFDVLIIDFKLIPRRFVVKRPPMFRFLLSLKI